MKARGAGQEEPFCRRAEKASWEGCRGGGGENTSGNGYVRDRPGPVEFDVVRLEKEDRRSGVFIIEVRSLPLVYNQHTSSNKNMICSLSWNRSVHQPTFFGTCEKSSTSDRVAPTPGALLRRHRRPSPAYPRPHSRDSRDPHGPRPGNAGRTRVGSYCRSWTGAGEGEAG
jgi:hypothetical protein